MIFHYGAVVNFKGKSVIFHIGADVNFAACCEGKSVIFPILYVEFLPGKSVIFHNGAVVNFHFARSAKCRNSPRQSELASSGEFRHVRACEDASRIA